MPCVPASWAGADGRRCVYAPHGLSDVSNLVIRPHPVRAPRSVHESKAARWCELWPELMVLGGRPGASGRLCPSADLGGELEESGAAGLVGAGAEVVRWLRQPCGADGPSGLAAGEEPGRRRRGADARVPLRCAATVQAGWTTASGSWPSPAPHRTVVAAPASSERVKA
ncbi:nucleotidyltransferase family protein [Streptomyces sp. NPDC017936]|uniref:nucleotidyltransferase family protein n=1 Tax=Streptomyces sp. NPDC017936 TaxID=3365016 RepID=UPI0037A2EAAC